jgi:DNA-binding protein H-NS
MQEPGLRPNARFPSMGFQQLVSRFCKMEEKTRMALKSMSVAKLKDLMGQVEAAIAEKVGARRRELEAQLSELAHHDPRGARGSGARGSVAPKYRNPKDPSQTWAGRGLQPYWVRDALKSGKKLDSFLIAKAAKKQ